MGTVREEDNSALAQENRRLEADNALLERKLQRAIEANKGLNELNAELQEWKRPVDPRQRVLEALAQRAVNGDNEAARLYLGYV